MADSKYNLRAIRERAEQDSDATADPQTSKPISQKTGKPAKQQTGKPVKQKASKPVSQQASVEEAKVNLTVKVPKSHRAYWVAQSRLQDTNLTRVINELLAERFGLPGDP